MAKRIDRPDVRLDAGHSSVKSDRHFASLGRALHDLCSSSHDQLCRTLAMTDWTAFSVADAVGAIAPLAFHDDAEVRQLVALQLAGLPAEDSMLACRALAMLACDVVPEVRREAMRAGHVAGLLGLTSVVKAATSPAEAFVESRLDGPLMTFTYRPNSRDESARLISIIAAWKATGMSDQTKKEGARRQRVTDDENHLPDMIQEGDQFEMVDLPRPGIAKDVLDVTKATRRLPDVLIEG